MQSGLECRRTDSEALAMLTIATELRSNLLVTIPNPLDPDDKRSQQMSDELMGETPLKKAIRFSEVFRNLDTQRNRRLVPINRASKVALPIYAQMLQVEPPEMRLAFVKELNAAKYEYGNVKVLTDRVLYDSTLEVREAALDGLKHWAKEQYGPLLLKGLDHPWPAVAYRAAYALDQLKLTETVPDLIRRLDSPASKEGTVKELVRVNHMRNCLLCHEPASDQVKFTAPLLTPGQPLPPVTITRPYYSRNNNKQEALIRPDVTFLRPDFSIRLPVEDAPWPAEQRFDFVTRGRTVKRGERPEIDRKVNVARREAVLYALRGLTGKDGGVSAEKWRELLDLSEDKKDPPQSAEDKNETRKPSKTADANKAGPQYDERGRIIRRS